MAESSDEEDFVSYGTALEPLDEDEVRRKPVSLEDQVVKDKEGRRRFHGAFTGGFSAGYFNTVGTKEGWTPSTFVSSRGQRAQQSRQNAEDFMDEDDLGDFGIAPRKIVTSKDFSNEDKTRKRQMAYVQHHAIPGEPPLPDLIVPSQESIGVQLLKKMGWKEGQGVGPKARRNIRAKANQSMPGVKQYGCAPPPAQGSDDSDEAGLDSFARDFLFAPKDNQEFSFRAKDDYHGIGYQGLDPSRAILGGGHVNLFGEDKQSYSRSGKKGFKGEAFGIGAFEDADDDVYSSDHMSRYDRVLGGEEPGDGKYGWTAPKHQQRGSESTVEGFKLSDEAKKANKVFPPPSLPRNFRPFHSFEPSSSPQPPGSDNFKSNRFTLSAKQRAEMLGEEQLPGQSSVFDMISKEDKNKLKEAQSQQRKPSSTSAVPPTRAAPPPPPPAGIPTASDPKFQWGSGTGFQPFAKDPEKQRRYEAFLNRSKGSKADSHTDIPVGSMTEWERHRETEEFTRAANLYRPLSGLMATRFVTAKNTDEDTVDVAAEEGGDKNDQTKAAEMKMFGKLTRDSFEWYPDKLLCKRFNIPDPYPGSTIVGLPKVKKDTFSVFNFLTISNPAEPLPPTPEMLAIMPASSHETTASSVEGHPPVSPDASKKKKSSSRWDQKIKLLSGAEKMVEGNAGAAASKTTTGDADTEDRPPIDLFKAIFQSSSSSSSSSEDDEEDGKDDDKLVAEDRLQHPEAATMIVQQSERTISDTVLPDVDKTPVGVQQSTKDTFNIRTDEQRPPQNDNIIGSASPMDEQSTAYMTHGVSENKADETSEDEYGPRLPPPADASKRNMSSKTDNTKLRSRDHRTSAYEESYIEKYVGSQSDRHRTQERTSDRYGSTSRSRGRHGDRSLSSEDGKDRHRKERHKEKHSSKDRQSSKDKHRHKHKKEKKTKKKKKKEAHHKSRHKERKKQPSSGSSDYDASDDTD
ncbi:G patch domain-containing protein 1-like [Amphiura filiformis]|uniref:G patch domain-containing protein 1-like n=1 Tax=Amphiura filiformis TaxID=82378 RepID=UPI003B228196